MVTALAWDNARAFNKRIKSVRMLQQSHGNDTGVVLTFMDNMPTPWRYGTPSGNGMGERPCCSNTRNEWPYYKPSKIAGKKEKQPSNIIATTDEQQKLETLDGTLELVGSR